jgi:hypothetical protein
LLNIVYPVITALGFLFVYPYPAKYVFQFSRNRQKEITNIKKSIEADTLLTAAEARAIRRELYQLEAELEKELSRKNNEIDNLKRELDGLRPNDNSSSSDLNKSNKTSIIPKQPSEEEIKVLIAVGKADRTGEAELLAILGLNSVKGKYLLGESVDDGYLDRDYDQGIGDYCYELTHKGRTLLVDQGYA